ncbi:MAG TPA: fumarylacetoacetate hydrolase family protein [Streptosporangiaceae bacterium]|nr:fumarylacetoacetate hydrolase family protein [Streptosporangiaceae bacterium]
MRFGTQDGRFVLVADGRVLDVHAASARSLPWEPLAALERWDEVRAFAPVADWAAARPLDERRLGPPVPRPRQIFAVALNYRPHAAEAGFVPPESPLVFTKFPTCVAGPDVTVRLPAGKVDWEVEVVAVIGRGGHRLDRAGAWEAVAGITCGQDLSERVLQLAGTPAQFCLGKSYPGFGPTGPVAVTPDELADRDDIGFASWLDGEPLQRGRTSEMIFPVDDLVARLSAVCPLLPGDLIFTGTPAGVGNRMQPPRYLRPGETLISRVDGVGEIRQRFAGAA